MGPSDLKTVLSKMYAPRERLHSAEATTTTALAVVPKAQPQIARPGLMDNLWQRILGGSAA